MRSPASRTPAVVDASALVALLTDDGDVGAWVATALGAARLAAPALAFFEAANVLRRLELTGELERGEAAIAHRELRAMAITLWPYTALADRTWELRHSTTVFDGSYVALAELLGAPLVTLDERLSRAPGPRCRFLTPSSA